ncbi:Eukaryotic translation initiation factor 3 subunit C [Dissostichus eleginoides]|uniref:Eukaryotic translation initiation factor 3 subunit C n=1 Tax=Dissostichus eleginoides TaxID=100907 RepID=A0AAD9CKM8_DISEL|nr:Eukaryotic translation initiation factor 3 subunit C [Dissostichus eleginoides]
MENMAEERRRSKEENAAATDKAARKDVKRFLADGDEDLELESGAEDEFVPEPKPEPAASTKAQKNYDDIPNIALASVRYGIGLRPTASIATAALIDAGIITEDNTSKVIDKNKVKRAQEKLMRELGEEFEEKCMGMGGICCILFDERIDLTNVMMEAEGSDQAFPAKIKEEHYSVASEPRHILFQLDCLKSQRKEVLDLVMPTVRRSAW